MLLFHLSFSTANRRMNSIYDPRLRRRDEWDGGRGWCRLMMYVGMGVGGVGGGGRVVVVVRLVWEGGGIRDGGVGWSAWKSIASWVMMC